MATREGVVTWGGIDVPYRRWGARLFGILLVLGLWMALGLRIPDQLLPPPWVTATMVFELLLQPQAWGHLYDTFSRVVVAFLGAMALGGILGTLLGLNHYGQKFFTPYMVAGLAIPGIAWAAVFTIIFGIGFTAPVLAGILTTFPYITINVWKGVENIDHDLVKMSRAFEVPRRTLFTKMILKNIAPSLFSAFRFGLAIGWKVVTTAEIFASTSGLGYMIIQTFSTFRYSDTWAWAALFVLLMVVLEYAILRPIERKVFEYRPDADFSRI